MEKGCDIYMVNLVAGKELPQGSYRERLKALEEIMEKHERLELQVRHHFAHGTYTRELLIPKGTLLTGKIHRHSCINIIAKGKILAVTDDGHHEIEAPHVFVSGPDVKKAGYALEDTVWINVHPWDGVMGLEEIERLVIAPTNEQIESQEVPCLG